jgi:hypothetical protein
MAYVTILRGYPTFFADLYDYAKIATVYDYLTRAFTDFTDSSIFRRHG